MSSMTDQKVEKSHLPQIRDNVTNCHNTANRIYHELTRLEETIEYLLADSDKESLPEEPNPPIITELKTDTYNLLNKLETIYERLILYNNKTIGTQ